MEHPSFCLLLDHRRQRRDASSSGGDGSFVFHLHFVYGNPGFGGQQDIFNCVQDLSVSGKHKMVDSLRQLTVYPEGNKPIDIHYSVVDDGAKGQFVRELFRPVLKEDYLYCASLNTLMMPDDGNMPVSLQWTEDEPFPITSYIDPKLKAGEWWEGKVCDLGISLTKKYAFDADYRVARRD